jgi:hypothetical protein
MSGSARASGLPETGERSGAQDYAAPRQGIFQPTGIPSKRFSNYISRNYEHRLMKGGIGHNLPQKAPKAFADAVIDIARA